MCNRKVVTNDATTSRGFCVLTHCNEKRLHVEHGVSPSHLILRLRQRSQAFETDFLLGCQSLIEVGEKRLGPSPAGREATSVSSCTLNVVGDILNGHMVIGCQGFRSGW